jgi:hypothetical protein
VTSKKADALSNFHERLFSPPASQIIGEIISPNRFNPKQKRASKLDSEGSIHKPYNQKVPYSPST